MTRQISVWGGPAPTGTREGMGGGEEKEEKPEEAPKGNSPTAGDRRWKGRRRDGRCGSRGGGESGGKGASSGPPRRSIALSAQGRPHRALHLALSAGPRFLPVPDGGCIVATVQPACTFRNHIRVRDVIVVTLDGRRVFREQDFAGQERERVLQVAHTRTLRAALDRLGPLPRTLTTIKNACCGRRDPPGSHLRSLAFKGCWLRLMYVGVLGFEPEYLCGTKTVSESLGKARRLSHIPCDGLLRLVRNHSWSRGGSG